MRTTKTSIHTVTDEARLELFDVVSSPTRDPLNATTALLRPTRSFAEPVFDRAVDTPGASLAEPESVTGCCFGAGSRALEVGGPFRALKVVRSDIRVVKFINRSQIGHHTTQGVPIADTDVP